MTMDLNTGKHHSEIIKCGLCEFIPSDLEKLNTHISTCEVYECSACWFRVTTISEIKKHVTKEHKGYLVSL